MTQANPLVAGTNETPSSPSIDSAEKNKQIYDNNNSRLFQLEKEIRVFHLYGSACDELLVWLKDDRAYSLSNEDALLKCLEAVFEKHAEYGRWSGIQLLKTASERCETLTDRAKGTKKMKRRRE